MTALVIAANAPKHHRVIFETSSGRRNYDSGSSGAREETMQCCYGNTKSAGGRGGWVGRTSLFVGLRNEEYAFTFNFSNFFF